MSSKLTTRRRGRKVGTKNAKAPAEVDGLGTRVNSRAPQKHPGGSSDRPGAHALFQAAERLGHAGRGILHPCTCRGVSRLYHQLAGWSHRHRSAGFRVQKRETLAERRHLLAPQANPVLLQPKGRAPMPWWYLQDALHVQSVVAMGLLPPQFSAMQLRPHG